MELLSYWCLGWSVTDVGLDTTIYDYFNLKDKDIEKTHNWNRDKYPITDSDV